MAMRLLFDTHAFLWWLEAEEPRLRPATSTAIRDGGNTVFVSVVNAWEIAIKVSMGKLRMTHSFADLTEHYGFPILPILLPHTMALRSLPLHHRDPFDRMLIAQAQVEGLNAWVAYPKLPIGTAICCPRPGH